MNTMMFPTESRRRAKKKRMPSRYRVLIRGVRETRRSWIPRYTVMETIRSSQITRITKLTNTIELPLVMKQPGNRGDWRPKCRDARKKYITTAPAMVLVTERETRNTTILRLLP